MQVIINKHYMSSNMPAPGTTVECFDIQEAFGEKYYLCLYNGILLSVKEKDIEEKQVIEITSDKKGQLCFKF